MWKTVQAPPTVEDLLTVKHDEAIHFLEMCGLNIKASQSFTVAITNIPYIKKSVVDSRAQFTCAGRKLPALNWDD